jgi:hypothetical protein
MKVTRDVVTDLWPVYLSGEASPDTRALVEQFLAGDDEFARRLKGNGSSLLACGAPALPLDHEARAFAQVRRKLHGYRWLHFMAILFTALSFGRIVADTSFDVSPRNFLIHVAIAAGFWIAYLVSLRRLRGRVLRRDVG